jgi:signal transduction histidine kinase
MATSIPITEFAAAERVPIEVIQRQASALAEVPLTAQLLNSVLNYVLILNQQRQIVFVSHNVRRLVGEAKAGESLGQRFGELLGCIHAVEHGDSCGTTEACTQCGALQAMIESLAGRKGLQECRMTRVIDCQPQALDLMVAATPFEYKGEQFAIVAVADISHEKRRRAFERLFFHDLINSTGGLEGLMRELKLDAPETLKPLLGLAETGFHDLLEQVYAQRDLAAAERDELALCPTVLDSLQVVDELADLFRRHELGASRPIAVAPGSARLKFVSDKSLLKRILGNLVKNALEASPEGQTVTIGCTAADAQVGFWVHNDGVMAPEVQVQVFNRSFSTKSPARGLGTYSVRLLTERYLKGNVHFTSRVPEGTTFRVLLPSKV